MAADNRKVRVSLIMPCYNEVKYISRSLDSIVANDYPKENIEVIIYDGGSTDGTLEILEKYRNENEYIRYKNNPKKIQAAALNSGIADALGEIIIRVDAHCIYEKDYISQAVKLLDETEAANVGGAQIGTGDSFFSATVAFAMLNPFISGNAYYRSCNNAPRYVDTVFLGAWRKCDLVKIGGFDESFRINEDYELNYRLREKKEKVLYSPSIKVKYFVRSSFPGIIRQYFRYGYWKAKTIIKHPGSLMPRQLAAPVFLLFLAITGGLFLLGHRIYLPGILIAYLAAFMYFTFRASGTCELRRLPLLFLLALVIHLSWGAGFWSGMVYWHGMGRIREGIK